MINTALLLELQQFLLTDLSNIHLPPHIDVKRHHFLGKIDSLNLGSISSVPEKSVPISRRRSFRNVAKFFGTKRYSLPSFITNR